MRILVVYAFALVSMLVVMVLGERPVLSRLCWCWPPVHRTAHLHATTATQEFVSMGSYGIEADWGNPDRSIPLDYSEDQGRRLFYQHCVWCHADSTPAGPSNRSNVTPEPPLLNNAAVSKGNSDATLEQMISLGGGALGKSPMMPAYGSTLSKIDIHDLIAYMRKLASASIPQPSPNTQAASGSNPQ
jgi:mono/diheme cytochrome c family protein